MVLVFPRRFRRTIIAQTLLVWAVLSSGCSTIGFYTQAITGHLQLMSRRQPLDEVIGAPDTEAAVRDKLELVESVRRFAANELGMPVEDAYASYVETGRRYVVWNVFAAPEFSLAMKTFCYPIAGCVAYKGFFERDRAKAEAARLRERGYDVFMGGVVAYSTLGWMADPVIDTFLVRTDARLAALLFHELAHRTVYLSGDTRFNESFATTVERAALRRFLAHTGNIEAYETYRQSVNRQQQVIDLILATRERLGGLYERDLDEQRVRREKHAIIEQMKADYRKMQATWGGAEEFSDWMSSDINNAAIGSVGAYHDLVPAFQAILAELDHDLVRFMEVCRTLSKMDGEDRERLLSQAASGIPIQPRLPPPG